MSSQLSLIQALFILTFSAYEFHTAVKQSPFSKWFSTRTFDWLAKTFAGNPGQMLHTHTIEQSSKPKRTKTIGTISAILRTHSRYQLNLSKQFSHTRKNSVSPFLSWRHTHTHTLTHSTHTNSIYSVSLVSSIGLDFFCSIHSYLMQDLSQVSNFLLVRSVSVS